MLGVLREHGAGHGGDAFLVGRAQKLMDLLGRQPVAAEGEQLIEQRLGVAHRAAGAAGDHFQRLSLGLHAFAGDDLLQPLDDAAPC